MALRNNNKSEMMTLQKQMTHCGIKKKQKQDPSKKHVYKEVALGLQLRWLEDQRRL